MAERRNYRGPRNRPMPLPYKDLRELLNMKKQQRQLEEQEGRDSGPSGGPPPDPPSLLRDSLRGDEPLVQRQDDHRPAFRSRGRGSFRRRSRGPRNHLQFDRGSTSDNLPRSKLFACNIKVELSTETGQRICTIENEKSETNPNSDRNENSENQGNFRGRTRGRGNYRRQYYYRGQNRRYNTGNRDNVHDNRRFKTEHYKEGSDISTKETVPPEEENWDNDDVKYNQLKESISKQNVEYINEENWDNDIKSNNLEKDVIYESKEHNADDAAENKVYNADDAEYTVENKKYNADDGEYTTEAKDCRTLNEEYTTVDEEEYDDEDAYNDENYEATVYNADEYEYAKDSNVEEYKVIRLQSEVDSTSEKVDLNNLEKDDGKISEDTLNNRNTNNLERININEGTQNKFGHENEPGESMNNDDKINKETGADADEKKQEKESNNKNTNKLNIDNISKQKKFGSESDPEENVNNDGKILNKETSANTEGKNQEKQLQNKDVDKFSMDNISNLKEIGNESASEKNDDNNNGKIASKEISAKVDDKNREMVHKNIVNELSTDKSSKDTKKEIEEKSSESNDVDT